MDCYYFIYCQHILLAALWAGADFQSIHVLLDNDTIPLQAGIFLCKNEDWQDCVQFFKPPAWGARVPTSPENNLGHCFRGRRQLSVDRIQGAPKAGIDIRMVRAICCFRDHQHIVNSTKFASCSLLGLSILYGQQDCAVACARLGLQQSGVELHRHANFLLRVFLHSEASSDHPLLDDYLVRNLKPSASECRSAAVAAGQAALIASWQREAAQKGVAVFQVMRKRSRSLVGDILAFSTEVPEFVEKLDLWNFLDGWTTLIPPNSESHTKEELHGTNQFEDPRAREHETGTSFAFISCFI